MRPDRDVYFMSIAMAVSLRASCGRRAVGCVLVNRDFNILSTGYNGPASGMNYCNPCFRSGLPSGEGLDKCVAIHAEQNALLQCPNTSEIHTAYITNSPCITCVKLFMNTKCKRIVFLNEYPQIQPKELWENQGRIWVQLDLETQVHSAIESIMNVRRLHNARND